MLTLLVVIAYGIDLGLKLSYLDITRLEPRCHVLNILIEDFLSLLGVFLCDFNVFVYFVFESAETEVFVLLTLTFFSLWCQSWHFYVARFRTGCFICRKASLLDVVD